MDAITYGIVDFEIIRTNFVNREQVRTEDDGAYLYTKWLIDIMCVFNNEGGTAYKLQAGGAPIPFPIPDDDKGNPGITDNALREYLMAPRRRLIITAAGTIILDSPRINPRGGHYLADANNGPFCEVVGITQMIGAATFFCHLRFTTYVNEYPEDTVSPPQDTGLILANRWVMAEDVEDETLYPIRRVSGQAVLRTDWMRARDFARGVGPSFNADSLRKYFFFPVPDNYQRCQVHVDLSSDGSRLNWSFVDQGRCYNLVGKGANLIRKIEVYQNMGILSPTDWRQTGFQISSGLMNSGWAVISAALSVARINVPSPTIRAPSLPSYEVQCACELWGDRSANRKDLMRIAIAVCTNSVQSGNLRAAVGMKQVNIRQAKHEKNVLVDMTCKFGSDTFFGAINNFIQLDSSLPTLNDIFGADDKLDAGKEGIVLNQAKGQNPSFTDNCKGHPDLIVALVSQILQQPNQTVPVPRIPMVAF